MFTNLLVLALLQEDSTVLATKQKALPPIDLAVPKKTETALFALG